MNTPCRPLEDAARVKIIGANVTDGFGNLALQDLTSRSITTLVRGGRRTGNVSDPVLSPDGRRVAYKWSRGDMVTQTPQDVQTSLAIVSAAGGASRTLIAEDPAVFSVWPVGWSPDGSRILAMRSRHRPSGQTAARLAVTGHELLWIAAESGAVTVIRTFEPGTLPLQVAISRSGQLLAYAMLIAKDESRVFVCDINGGNERVIVSMAGNHSRPIWAPNDTHVLFNSTRSGSTGLWAVALHDGQASASPVLARSTTVNFLNMSSAGTLYYVDNTRNVPTVYAIDRSGPTVKVVQTSQGQAASLSPDGQTLAFIRQGQPDNDLILRSVADGSERLIRHVGLAALSPKWLATGSGLLVFVQPAGDDNRPGGSFYQVDLQSGAFTRRFSRNTDTEVRSNTGDISPDGSVLYVAARPSAAAPPQRWTSIVGLDTMTGDERVRIPLPESPLGTVGLAVSPDGSEIAVHSWIGTPPEVQGTGPSKILSFRTDGNGSRTLAGPFVTDRTNGDGQWTPDGRAFLYNAMDQDTGAWQMMRVPVAGGTAVPDGLSSAALQALRGVPRMSPLMPAGLVLSPNGSRLYTVNFAEARAELWALDNLMSTIR